MIQNMEKEDLCRKTANTEYVPTKCRITRPPPPKPATNPLQFVQVGPCALYKKAQEQIKKAKDVKVIRKEVREEAEDWQHNLDSWKSSRRKRQEHIIERVEEVKKLEQEGQERNRKQKTTFNDILEKRGRGRPKFNIPIYDDDSNDLSDYGIGLSSSKSDKSSDNTSQTSKEDLNECQNLQYGSNDLHEEKKSNDNDVKTDQLNNHINDLKAENSSDYASNENNIGPYTYEGAIQNYRMRIKTKINVNEVIFNNRTPDPPKNKEYTEVQSLLPKGNIFKRKELFEGERNSVENTDNTSTRKFSEDFANTQSIKERLQSLEKCTESLVKNDNKNALPVGTVTSKLQKFNIVTDNYSKINKNNFGDTASKSISNYSLDGLSSGGEENKSKWGEKYEYNQYFSPEDSIFMDKINMFNHDLDTLYPKSSSDNCTDEFMNSYPPSTSSTELMVLSSDKEDSGIHTADVSCSVSQSDEVLEDVDISSNTIPKCIEKLNIEKITKENNSIGLEEHSQVEMKEEEKPFEEVIDKEDFICNNLECVNNKNETILVEKMDESFKNLDIINNDIIIQEGPMDLPPFDMDCLADNVLLSPILPKLQPPAVKPPPPPVSDTELAVTNVENDKKFNTTKRLKKEILIKRSTFLGLEEPTDDQMFPDVPFDKPPDVNNFLQKLNGSMDGSSKEDISNISSPVFNNGPTVTVNSGISSNISKIQNAFEEDEITKKEREIIELVEKEEKSKDHEPLPAKGDFPNLLSDYKEQYPYNYNNPYYLDSHFNNLDDRDSEVLKVEHELLQLEKEERERQKENMLFREKSMKIKQNYHSYENLCDVNTFPENTDYYKSMPELQQFPKDYNNKPPISNPQPLYDNLYYRKSMPDMEHVYNALDSDYNQQMRMTYNNKVQPPVTTNHRKTSMPELQKVPQTVSNLPIIAAKPLKRPTKEEKEMFKRMHYEKQMKPIARHSLLTSSASRPKHHDNWRQPKTNAEPKNYNQHWLIQEAEFRRISEKQNSMPSRMHSNETHLNSYGARNPPIKASRPEPPIQKDNNQLSHLGHSQAGYTLMPYSSSTGADESQNVILSVSGKKKCSYCGNELGRGAAMIIETLNLFYHMECFKCCVCHVELGDGLMGTDVRVRNQKLHCHNCYSSDDGIKFSCV